MSHQRNGGPFASSMLRFPWPAVVLLAVGLAGSYSFYHVNNLKLLVLAAGIALLALIRCVLALSSARQVQVPWRIWAILSLPVLATVPGYLLHRGMTHYLLPVELASNLLLILWTVLLYQWIRDRRDVLAFLVACGATLGVISTYALLQANGLLSQRGQADEELRVAGTFGSPNVLAAFLIPLLPFFLILAGRFLLRFWEKESLRSKEGRKPAGRKKAVNDRPRRRPIGWGVAGAIVFLLGAVTLFLSGSRVGTFAWLMSGGIAFALTLKGGDFLKGRFRSSAQSLIVLALIILGAGLGRGALSLGRKEALEDYTDRIASVSTFRGWSSRMVPWDAALTSIRQSPLFGFGLGTSYELFFENVSPASRAYADGRSFSHAHSEILETAQEGGALGVLMTGLLFAYVFVVAVKALRRKGEDPLGRDLAAAVICGMMAYGASAAITESSRMIATKLAVHTALAIGLALPRLAPLRPDEEDLAVRAPRPWLGCAIAITMVAAVFGLLAPWLGSIRGYAVVAAQPISASMMKRMDTEMAKRANLYGRYFLADYQVKTGKNEEARQNLKWVLGVIPHYRESEYLMAYLTLQEGDREQARALALDYAGRDRYYKPNLALLTTIGAATRDTSLVFSQIAALSEWVVIRGGITRPRRGVIEVTRERGIDGVEIRQLGPRTQIVWSEMLVEGIYRSRVSTLHGWTSPDRDRFAAWLDKELQVRGIGEAATKEPRINSATKRLRTGVLRLVQ